MPNIIYMQKLSHCKGNNKTQVLTMKRNSTALHSSIHKTHTILPKTNDNAQIEGKLTSKILSTKKSVTAFWTSNAVITLVICYFLLAFHRRPHENNPNLRETELSHVSVFDFPPTSQIHSKSKPLMTQVDQTAIVVIAMGDIATNTNLVERCLRSIRVRGQFEGHFVILTDHPERYTSLEQNDEYVTLLTAKNNDLFIQIENLSIVMRYKRFKTLLLDYVKVEPRLEHIQRLLYMDYDIVVGRNLNLFWNDFDNLIAKHDNKKSYMYFFREDWNKQRREPFHAGVMVLDRDQSAVCLDVWRVQIDAGKVNRDQQGLKLLNDRIESGEESRCQMRYLEPRDEHLMFPTAESMQRNEHATFVHVTNTKRAKGIPSNVQKDYFTQLLQLDDGDESDLTKVHIVPKWKEQERKAKQKEEKKQASPSSESADMA